MTNPTKQLAGVSTDLLAEIKEMRDLELHRRQLRVSDPASAATGKTLEVKARQAVSLATAEVDIAELPGDDTQSIDEVAADSK